MAFTIRAVLLMTLMPDADAREVLTTLLGELVEVPWQRAHTVPSGTVLSTWRTAIGPAPLQELQRELLAAVVAEHRPDRLLAVRCAAGSARLHRRHRDPDADTAANRAVSGTAGAAETGYPQIRHLHISDALTRATLAVVTGPAGGDKAEAEQALLDRALAEQPDVFGPDRLWIMDRNFPGVARIKAMLATGSHVLIRVESDIRLPRIGGFAEDGSYLALLSGGGTTLTMRVVEYYAPFNDRPRRAVLPGHRSARPHHPPGASTRRCLPVAVGRIRDRPAGGQVGHPRRRPGDRGDPALTHPEPDPAGTRRLDRRHRARPRHHRLGRHHCTAVPERPTHRSGRRGPRLSFTTARRTLITTVRAGAATASLPAPARAAAHHTALAVIASARVTTDRHRHRDHKIKTRQPFPHAPRGITTRTAPAHVHVCGTTAA